MLSVWLPTVVIGVTKILELRPSLTENHDHYMIGIKKGSISYSTAKMPHSPLRNV